MRRRLSNRDHENDSQGVLQDSLDFFKEAYHFSTKRACILVSNVDILRRFHAESVSAFVLFLRAVSSFLQLFLD